MKKTHMQTTRVLGKSYLQSLDSHEIPRVPSPQSLAMPEAIRREACPGPRRWWLSNSCSTMMIIVSSIIYFLAIQKKCAMELDKWTFWRASKKWPGTKILCCYIHNNIGILPQQVPSVQKHEASADLPARVPNQWDEKGRIYSPSTTLMEARGKKQQAGSRYLLVYVSLTTWLWAWSWRFSVCLRLLQK